MQVQQSFTLKFEDREEEMQITVDEDGDLFVTLGSGDEAFIKRAEAAELGAFLLSLAGGNGESA